MRELYWVIRELDIHLIARPENNSVYTTIYDEIEVEEIIKVFDRYFTYRQFGDEGDWLNSQGYLVASMFFFATRTGISFYLECWRNGINYA